MDDSELEVVKKIAETECLKIELVDPEFDTRYYATLVNKKLTEYNPFDWSILGPLMIKHRLVIKYTHYNKPEGLLLNQVLKGTIWVASSKMLLGYLLQS